MFRIDTLGGLTVSGGDPPGTKLLRPRRLGVLAVLAVEGPQPVTRDRLLQILWPDSEPERGRHALSQTLYGIRQDLGGDVAIGTPADLRLDPSRISADLQELRVATRNEDWRQAATLYRGPLLQGFSIADLPDFDRWIEEQRAVIRREALAAIERAAQLVTRDEGIARSVGYWEQLTAADPLSARYCLGLMEALTARGESGRALHEAKVHTDLVRQELDAAADPAILRLSAQLRQENQAASAAARGPSPALEAPRQGPAPPLAASRTRWIPAAIGGVLAVGALALALLRPSSRERPLPGPIVAVGEIRSLLTTDSTLNRNALGNLLATSLSRAGDLAILPPTSLYERLPRGADSIRAAWAEAAGGAGAQQLVEGEVSQLNGVLRLDVRRIDLRTGRLERGYRFSGGNPLVLIDSVTIAVSRDLAGAGRAPNDNDRPTGANSLAAARSFDEGLRAYFQYDAAGAHRLFEAALAADSTYPLAAYYSWLTSEDQRQDADRARLALRLAPRTALRDRLIVRAHIGAETKQPDLLPVADSLLLRFPDDPEALFRAATLRRGLAVEAVAPVLERAIVLDSTTSGGRSGNCRLCQTLALLSEVYWAADSTGARERTLVRWTRLVPTDPAGWRALGTFWRGRGLAREATAAAAKAREFGFREDSVAASLELALVTSSAEVIERHCSNLVDPRAADSVLVLRWQWCVRGWRELGRLRDALRLNEDSRPRTGRFFPRDPILSAILDGELGRAQVAAAGLQNIALVNSTNPKWFPGEVASELASSATLAAHLLVGAGDTATARLLVDSVRVAGARSGYPGDQSLHRYIVGLIALQAGDYGTAIDQLGESVGWAADPTLGAAALGKAFLAAGRPTDAIRVLRRALGGPVEGRSRAQSRVALRLLLAKALEAGDQLDGAATEYRLVERAWRNSDGQLQESYREARQWLERNRRPLAK